MQDQTKLFKIHRDHLKDKKVQAINKKKGFARGYNKEFDVVIISNDGTLGDIYEIQGLMVGIPLTPSKKNSIDGSELPKEDQVFTRRVKPAKLGKIKSMPDFRSQPESVKSQYYDYITEEWDYRTNGYWFMCNGEPTFLTPSHYFFVNWASIDTEDGYPEFRHSNRIFHYFWDACKADTRCYGICYLKNRRSGFSYMAAAETVHQATQTRNSKFGILSKTGADAKELFTNKVVSQSSGLPFFFRPLQAGMDKPKTILEYAVPSVKLSRKNIQAETEEEDITGLDTYIEWKNTGDNAFDGYKLKLLVHDESGKWVKPDNILKNWSVTKTCLRLGKKIIGKCMMGSTSNKLDSGGEEFKKMYNRSDLTKVKRNANGQTPTGMYAFFINALWNMEGFFDKYGWPVIDTPEEPIEGVDGDLIDVGCLDYWQAEVDGLKEDPDRQNEYYRQFPLSEKHAFRDEISESLFNITKIYEQIDYNEEMGHNTSRVTVGSFAWKNGVKDTEVVFHPNPSGRFKLTWIPPVELQNNIFMKNGVRLPGNDGLGAFGCDSYDISGTVGGGGSNGALHGLTSYNLVPKVPSSRFFLEYVARPQTADIFFEDVLMACVFYGMPILCENNKPRLLYHFKRRGYRGFSMNRPDRAYLELSKAEKEIGGIPNSSEDVKQAHASAIESYIEDHVGIKDHETMEHGQMYFNRTLDDWVKFDITARTKFDASISSGLAIMAVQKYKYAPHGKRESKKVDFGFSKYRQTSGRSIIIENK